MAKTKKTINRSSLLHTKTDRRIVRTRNALGDAMVALMLEKEFDEITVQQVLDRAGVGRATFYTHYRDKDDLFLSDVEEFLEMFSGVLKRRERPLRDWCRWRSFSRTCGRFASFMRRW